MAGPRRPVRAVAGAGPLVVVVVIAVLFFAAMVAEAFGEGFAVGCATLAAPIGTPSLVLL